MIVEEDEILQNFSEIQTLFFWTGFNGTRVFHGNAPSGTVYGGGEIMNNQTVNEVCTFMK